MRKIAAKAELPDGRAIRPLTGHSQKTLFALRSSGLYAPAAERIMLVEDHDISIRSYAYIDINVNNQFYAAEYVFYPKGFETRGRPFGDRLVYVEDGVPHTMLVPDVAVRVLGPNGRPVRDGLRQALGLSADLRKSAGMGVIRLEKLKLKPDPDSNGDIVSVTSDFDPATDVRVVNLRRSDPYFLFQGVVISDNWSFLAEGHPSRPPAEKAAGARYLVVMQEGNFETASTGYHGSMARVVSDGCKLLVFAGCRWSDTSVVTLIERTPDKE
jgi:hypothetical protein